MWKSLQVQTGFIVEGVLSTKGYIFLLSLFLKIGFAIFALFGRLPR